MEQRTAPETIDATARLVWTGGLRSVVLDETSMSVAI